MFFNVVLMKQLNLLNINIKGEGFANLSNVQCETFDGNRYDLQPIQNGNNEIRFDDVFSW